MENFNGYDIDAICLLIASVIRDKVMPGFNFGYNGIENVFVLADLEYTYTEECIFIQYSFNDIIVHKEYMYLVFGDQYSSHIRNLVELDLTNKYLYFKNYILTNNDDYTLEDRIEDSFYWSGSSYVGATVLDLAKSWLK